MRPFVLYSVLRIGMFVASLVLVGGLWALVAGGTSGVPWLFVILFAAVLSAVGSWTLLRRQREELAQVVARQAGRASEALERQRSKEDVD